MTEKNTNSINNNESISHIGIRIKEIRRELRISQKDFAEEVNISGSFLSEVEAGKSKPGYEFITSVTQKYNVNPMYLLTGDGGMFQAETPEETLIQEHDYGDLTQMVREMLRGFKRSPVIALAVLEFYKRYIYQNRDMIEDEADKGLEYSHVQ
jgi:transcriptional regulator with XRE-family HTH domain